MPPFAIAHMFCASRDGSKKSGLYRRCLLKERYFCAVYGYAGTADLCKGNWNPKRKLGVTTHFSEIILKLQFGEKCHTLFCILAISALKKLKPTLSSCSVSK